MCASHFCSLPFLKGSEKTTHHTSLDKERQSQLKLLRFCILAQHTSAYVSIRQHTSEYDVRRRMLTYAVATQASPRVWIIHTHRHTQTHIHTYIHTYIYIYVYALLNQLLPHQRLCIYIHKYINASIYIYRERETKKTSSLLVILQYIYTHTHIHTYICTYLCAFTQWNATNYCQHTLHPATNYMMVQFGTNYMMV